MIWCHAYIINRDMNSLGDIERPIHKFGSLLKLVKWFLNLFTDEIWVVFFESY